MRSHLRTCFIDLKKLRSILMCVAAIYFFPPSSLGITFGN